jgi:hypothetical protein
MTEIVAQNQIFSDRTGRKMILAAINGPWQTITFLHFYLFENEILNEDMLEIIFYDIDTELEEICRKILRVFNFQKKTYNLSLLDQIRSLNFDQIWISKLFSQNPHVILQTFRNSDIVLFEEGLHSYAPKKFISIAEILKTEQKKNSIIRDLLEYQFNGNGVALKPLYAHLILKSHFSRCIKNYLLLDMVKNSDNTIIENKKLPAILDKAGDGFVRDLWLPLYPENSRKKVMIIAQYFSYLNVLTYTDEIHIYKQMVNYYLNMDYIIYWKSHPRMATFEQELVNEFSDEKLIFIRSKLPAEFYSHLYPDIEYIGISSSSLLYKSLIFKGEAYQVAQNVMDKINHQSPYAEDFRTMYKLISKFVPVNEHIQIGNGN